LREEVELVEDRELMCLCLEVNMRSSILENKFREGWGNFGLGKRAKKKNNFFGSFKRSPLFVLGKILERIYFKNLEINEEKKFFKNVEMVNLFAMR